MEEPYKFSAEFTVEQAYLGGADVQRGPATSTISTNIIPTSSSSTRRASSSASSASAHNGNAIPLASRRTGGQQLPNTLQAVNSIVGLDTKFSDSLLFRFEAQPGFYGTTFDHLNGDSFNVPFVLGGTYIYTPELQFVFGVGVNVQGPIPSFRAGAFAGNLPRAGCSTPPSRHRGSFDASRNLTLFAGANIKANTFRVDDRLATATATPA